MLGRTANNRAGSILALFPKGGGQNKPALAESGMRDDDLRIVQHQIADVQNVQINFSRRVSGPLRRTTHLSLDTKQLIQQSNGWPTEIDLHHRVEVGCRAGFAIDRGCLVNRGDPNRRACRRSSAQAVIFYAFGAGPSGRKSDDVIMQTEMSKLQRHFVPGYDRYVPPGHFAQALTSH